MDIKSQKILDKLSPYIEKSSKKWWALLLFLGLILLGGLTALIIMLKEGHSVTGMRDYVPWGIFITNFIYLLGFSYAGAIISAVLHLTRITWMKPVKRILELLTLFLFLIGPLYIFLCIGRLDRFHHLLLYSKIQSPMTWDKLAVATFMVFFVVYIFIFQLKDFAMMRDNKELKLSKWKRKIYAFLAINYKGTAEQKGLLDQAQNVMAAIIIPTSILAYSLLAWLFGMNLRPGWHSSIFAPLFVVTAVYSSIALLIVVMWVYRKMYKLQDIIQDRLFYYLGFSLLIMTFIYAYFSFSEFITDWYNLDKTHEIWLMKFFKIGEFGLTNYIMIAFTIILPIVIFIIPKFRSINSIALISLLVVIGLWLKRYLLIVVTLETPYVPMQDLRPEYVHYQGSWIEWILTVSGVALFVVFFMLYNKFMPIIPIVDHDPHEKVNVPSPFYKSFQK